MNDINERIIELCKLNGVFLHANADERGVKWHAVQCEWRDGKTWVRNAAGHATPEEAIAACKCREWEESKPWTPAAI